MLVTPKPGSDGDVTAPYRRIAAELRAEIEDGRPRVGRQMPTQDKLERRFGVSRATIQRALQELRRDGYIDSQRGRGAYVLDRPVAQRVGVKRSRHGQAEPELAAHVAAAFEVERVTLDVFSLTTETLNKAVQVPLQRIRSRDIQPDTITVRLLLPTLEGPLAVPRRVDDVSDEQPLKRLRRLTRNQAEVFQNSLQDVADRRLVSEVSLQIKTVPFTPTHKLYLLNGREALFAYYEVVDRTVSIKGEDMMIYDFLGLDAELFHYSTGGNDPDPHDVEFVRRSQRWFDSLWSTIAEPLTLFE